MERAPVLPRTLFAPRSAASRVDRPSLLRSLALAGAVAMHAAVLLWVALPVEPFEPRPDPEGGLVVVIPAMAVKAPIIRCWFPWKHRQQRLETDARDAARQGVMASVSPVPAIPLAPEEAVSVVGGDTPRPNLPLQALLSPAPEYPLQALRARLSGWVEIEVVVGADGIPLRASVVRSSGHRALDRAALATVLTRWRFRPQLHDGEAVEAAARVPVVFVLPQTVARG